MGSAQNRQNEKDGLVRSSVPSLDGSCGDTQSMPVALCCRRYDDSKPAHHGRFFPTDENQCRSVYGPVEFADLAKLWAGKPDVARLNPSIESAVNQAALLRRWTRASYSSSRLSPIHDYTRRTPIRVHARPACTYGKSYSTYTPYKQAHAYYYVNVVHASH